VHPFPELLFEVRELRYLLLPQCPAAHLEPAFPRLSAVMGETQECEGVGCPLATSLAILGRKATELDQARLVGVELEVKAFQPGV